LSILTNFVNIVKDNYLTKRLKTITVMQQTIVIVEDERPIAQMYELKLKNAGYRVVIAENGQKGYEAIKDYSPDLVLLDLKMPVMTGDKMLEKVRSEDWGSKTRVIVLTNISRDEAPTSLRMLGVDRYLVKVHHTPAQVVAVAQEVLNN
jgi:DNA-binding response OmpR family regulator